MPLQNELEETGRYAPESLDRFSGLIDPEWIDEALQATGTVSVRRRRLPADRLVWLVIGLALFRNEPIWHIVRQLDLALSPQAGLPVPSAAIQGRQRLGEAPLAWLFQRLAQAWAGSGSTGAAGLSELRHLAVDGVVWSVPDTPANRNAFGSSASQHGAGSWPQVRGVCLMDTDSHLLLGAALGPYATGELRSARQLMDPTPDHSLTIFDRAYFAAAFLLDWQHAGEQRHWLMRAKDSLRFEVIQKLGKRDCWIRMPISPQARQQRPDLPAHWEARLIELPTARGRRRFLTSLADTHLYPARALAEHYRQRWEIELGYREIKQSLLTGRAVLRSKQPELVRQELWGLLIAYNLLRQEMRQIALTLQVPPQRLSFQWLALAIVGFLRLAPLERPGTLPQRLAHLCQQARAYVLPPRRDRTYPRQIKLRPHNHYPIKKCQSAN